MIMYDPKSNTCHMSTIFNSMYTFYYFWLGLLLAFPTAKFVAASYIRTMFFVVQRGDVLPFPSRDAPSGNRVDPTPFNLGFAGFQLGFSSFLVGS